MTLTHLLQLPECAEIGKEWKLLEKYDRLNRQKYQLDINEKK